MREKTAVSANNVGKIWYLHVERLKLGPHLLCSRNSNFKWIPNLNLRPETLKWRERARERNRNILRC